MSARSLRRAHARRVARERRRVAQARQRALVAGATLGATAVFAANAEAATYVVNSTADDGTGTCNPSPDECTLRDAVTTANGDGTPDTVELSGVSGTIALDPGRHRDHRFRRPEHQRAGAGHAYRLGRGRNRNLQINRRGSRLDLRPDPHRGLDHERRGDLCECAAHVDKRHDQRQYGDGLGGGVYSEDDSPSPARRSRQRCQCRRRDRHFGKYDVVIENSTISGNTAENGGGIFVFGGSLSLTQSTISGNTSSQDGGGIHSRTKYDTTIDNSTIAQNAAADSGGGIYLAQYGDESGTAAITARSWRTIRPAVRQTTSSCKAPPPAAASTTRSA